MKAVITGATGFIGQKLLPKISHPVVISRDPLRAKALFGQDQVKCFSWEDLKNPDCQEIFKDTDYIFHLAGENVASGRWNAQKKQVLRDSRIQTAKRLVQSLVYFNPQPKALVSASAVGIYDDHGDEIITEETSAGDKFLSQLCVDWEHNVANAKVWGVRTVMLRIGIVLGNEGGILAKLLPIFRLGLGGTLSTGKQWMPWIHVDDVVNLFLTAAQNEQYYGPINAVAPQPVTNREFTKALGKALHVPTLFPVPKTMLRLALGEFADIVLSSQRVMPTAAMKMGYSFKYDTINKALVITNQK